MKKLIFFVCFIFLMLFSVNFVLAASGTGDNTGGASGNANNGTCPSGTPAGTVCLANPRGRITTPQALIGKVINTVLGVVGSLALIMFIFGGLTWMTSAGSPEKVKKGREIIVWAAIGLIIVFASYALVRFLLASI